MVIILFNHAIYSYIRVYTVNAIVKIPSFFLFRHTNCSMSNATAINSGAGSNKPSGVSRSSLSF
jgi:hypothetical protein